MGGRKEEEVEHKEAVLTLGTHWWVPGCQSLWVGTISDVEEVPTQRNQIQPRSHYSRISTH